MAVKALEVGAEFGPMMRKLDVTGQLFVCMMFEGSRSITECAARAGMVAINRGALRTQAHRMLRKPDIAAAVIEEAKRRNVFMVPKVHKALSYLLDHPEHADHFKALKMIRDDAGVTRAVERTLNQNITIEVSTADKVAAITKFAQSHGIDPKTLLGFNPEPIDAEFEEVEYTDEQRAELEELGVL